MDSKQKQEEIKALIDNIKRHSDRLSEKPSLPLLEISVILSKITRLHEKTAILKFLLAQEQNYAEEPNEEEVRIHAARIEQELEESKEEQNISSETSSSIEDPSSVVSHEDFHPVKPTLEEIPSEKETTDLNEEPIPEESIEEETTEEEFKLEKTVNLQEEAANETQEEMGKQEELPTIDLEKLLEEEEVHAIPDLNEQYSEEEDPSLSEQLRRQPIADLLTAIGLNERYLYANELFGGDIEEFKNVVRTLNEFENGEQAKQYFSEQLCISYGWKTDNELVIALYKLLERRYQ